MGRRNLGFIVSLILRMKYPGMRIVVFGRNAYKLNDFTFVDETRLTYEAGDGFAVDHAFECCGGDGSASAIDQIIDVIKSEGTVSLLAFPRTRFLSTRAWCWRRVCACSAAVEAGGRTSSTPLRCTKRTPRS